MNNFIGKDGFYWWYGIVEDRNDPLKLGRCKVRCVGWHTDNKMSLPTEALPWANVIIPINSHVVHPPKEGEMVVGFFEDGHLAQKPVILGTIPGIPLKEPNHQEGFTDNRTDDVLKSSPRQIKEKTYNTDGSGISIIEGTSGVRYPNILDEPSTNRLARNDEESIDETFIKERKDNRVTGIQCYDSSWDEPEVSYGAKYPYNKALETESGHIVEMDDTPGKERLHLAHRTGSFIEITPDGSKIEKVVKDNYIIIMKDDNVYVMGKCNLTVQGSIKVYAKSDVYLKVDGKIEGTIDNTVNLTSPTFNLFGDVNVDGNIHASKEISDYKRSMSDDRTIYNGHTHSDPQGGSVAPTNQKQ